jgi:hypothetical protein
MELEAHDIIAILIIIGAFILLALHIDSIVGGILVAIVSYYFGHKSRRSYESKNK